ncbi:class I SAM-dependent RNA methyltransferase [Nannocystis radixulma]|uniref:TRAM domain-containing protein n=1 Tax=Nannocystis radixulma TaxID=2995305 RepID=A0ABT5B8K3_9BACT|nr:hypothetical protein [Nannocystis radixulma]MDC0669970.1 hypothetical protein [Nannocystis radixulma]
MRGGDLLTLDLDVLGPEGEGVSEQTGTFVHVPGGYPGERVEARVEHASRQAPRAHARLASLLQPHPARRPPPCPHSDAGAAPRAHACSGCPLQALDVAVQRELKRAALVRRHGLDPGPLVASPDEWGYRWSSKRIVTGTLGHVLVGSYHRGSHTPAAMDDCRVDHPAIAAAARELQAAASALAIEPYDEATGAGDLRYAWFKTDGRDVLLTLVTAARPSPAAELLPASLTIPSGIAWSVQSGRGNAVRGDPPVLLRGSPVLTVSLAGVPVDVGPLGFLQPNPRVAELAYRDLVADEGGAPHCGALAFDLYAGTGVTTALLRRGFAEVVPCEVYPESAAALGISAEPAEAFLARQRAAGRVPELVVCNPPRGGMGRAVCAELVALAAPRLQIMSCSADALVRDLAVLQASGYALRRLRAYDTLPHTPHLELVAWLSHETGAD